MHCLGSNKNANSFATTRSKRQWTTGSRLAVIVVQAKLKVAQNHKKSGMLSIDSDKLYTDGSFLPDAAFGPVKLVTVKGQGRGLATTSEIQPGDLLLISTPAGPVVRGEEGRLMGADALAPTMMLEGMVDDEEKRRLRLLLSYPEKTELKDYMYNANRKNKTTKADKGPSKGFGKPQAAQSEADPLQSPAELTELINRYGWAQEYNDIGATACRKEQSYATIGVWPEFALVNHACAPNSIPVLISNRMLLRAVRHMPVDTHVTINYLSFSAATPLSYRRSKLKEQYRFQCKCPRCQAEEKQPEEIQTQIEDMFTWIRQPEVAEKLGLTSSQQQCDSATLADMEKAIQEQVDKLEALMDKHQLQILERVWMRTSAYQTYEMLALVKYRRMVEKSQTSGKKQDLLAVAALIADLVPMASSFAAAGDVHLYLTLDWLDYVGNSEPSQQQQQMKDEAGQTALAAHLMRYGRVPDAVLVALMQARARNRHEFGRVILPTINSAVHRSSQELGAA